MRRLFSRFTLRAGMLAIGLASISTQASADWEMTVNITGSKGPHAVCLASIESDDVLSGYVTAASQISFLMPVDGYYFEKGETGVIVSGSAGSVTIVPDREKGEVTADLSRAEPMQTSCTLDNVISIEDAETQLRLAIEEKLEGNEIVRKISDPVTVREYFNEQRGRSLRAYRAAGISGLVRGMEYDALTDAIERMETAERRRKAREMIDKFFAALATMAEERKAAAERRKSESYRERDAARSAFREAEAKSAREAEGNGDVSFPGQQCFGAVGQGCAPLEWDWEKMFPKGSTCTDVVSPYVVECSVNTGSWAHDECCVRHPEGKKCGRSDSRPNQCATEWTHAEHHTIGQIYTWKAIASRQVWNMTGFVNHGIYCAPKGQALAPGEGDFHCCSNSAVRKNVWRGLLLVDADICTK